MFPSCVWTSVSVCWLLMYIPMQRDNNRKKGDKKTTKRTFKNKNNSTNENWMLWRRSLLCHKLSKFVYWDYDRNIISPTRIHIHCNPITYWCWTYHFWWSTSIFMNSMEYPWEKKQLSLTIEVWLLKRFEKLKKVLFFPILNGSLKTDRIHLMFR